jgi:hypothetical protein
MVSDFISNLVVPGYVKIKKAILAGNYRGYPQSVRVNTGRELQLMLRPLPSLKVKKVKGEAGPVFNRLSITP